MIIWMIKAHPTKNRMASQATTEFALSEPRFPSRGQGNAKPVAGEAATLHYGVMSAGSVLRRQRSYQRRQDLLVA